MYKIINEKLGLASCSLSDLTMQQVAEFLEQWEEGALISSLTLFYDKGQDLVVLNRDHKDYETYLVVAEAFLAADEKEIKNAKESVPKSFQETIQVLENCKRYRKIKDELRITGHQVVVGFKGTFLCCFFDELMKECKSFSNLRILMSQVYNYGVIQGKREERARRRGKS